MIKEIREMLTDSVPILFLIDYDKDNTKEVEQVLCIKNTNTLKQTVFCICIKRKDF